jgi:chromosome segregation ATPase
MKPNKSNYEEYRKERNRREEEIRALWDKEHKIMKKIRDLETKLHDDYPETCGEDPGY